MTFSTSITILLRYSVVTFKIVGNFVLKLCVKPFYWAHTNTKGLYCNTYFVGIRQLLDSPFLPFPLSPLLAFGSLGVTISSSSAFVPILCRRRLIWFFITKSCWNKIRPHSLFAMKNQASLWIAYLNQLPWKTSLTQTKLIV